MAKPAWGGGLDTGKRKKDGCGAKKIVVSNGLIIRAVRGERIKNG